jgi:hypothetical protein
MRKLSEIYKIYLLELIFFPARILLISSISQSLLDKGLISPEENDLRWNDTKSRLKRDKEYDSWFNIYIPHRIEFIYKFYKEVKDEEAKGII